MKDSQPTRREIQMKYLVVYDTSYGNTARIAVAIRDGLGVGAQAIEVEKLGPEDLQGVQLLVVGSPTQGGRPTRSIEDWLQTLPFVHESSAAAFDTRLGGQDASWLTRTLLGTVGFAAPRIARSLAGKGHTIIGESKGFIVAGKEGPLQNGELERAKAWGGELLRHVKQVAVSQV
jgi:flavodoxin I